MKGISDKLMFWGFCSTFFFIPVATTPAVIAGLLTLSLWIFTGRFIKDSHLWFKQKWFVPVLLFMSLPLIGLLYTDDIKTGLDFAKKSYYWLYAFAIASLPFQRYSPTLMLNAFLLGLSLAAVISITQLVGIFPMTKGIHMSFINPITYRLFLVFGMLILSFYFGKVKEIKQKILFGSGMLLYFLNLYLSIDIGGRSAYPSFILMTPLMIYNLLSQRHILKTAIISFFIMVALFLSPLVQNPLNDAKAWVKLYYEGDPNTSVGLRLHLWEGAVRIFLENPIIGVGTGGYQSAMKKYETPMLRPELRGFSQPHNSFLYMAANFGIVGVILLCWIFFVFLEKGWKHRDNLIGFSILSFGLVVLIGSLTDTQILQVHTGLLFAFLMGLQSALGEK